MYRIMICCKKEPPSSKYSPLSDVPDVPLLQIDNGLVTIKLWVWLSHGYLASL